MTRLSTIVQHLIEEGIAARAHFQTWWALRNRAIPDFLPDMNHLEYVDFFHVSNSGHYKLFFIAISKIFDRDTRASGIASLREGLRAEGHDNLADYVEAELEPLTERVCRIQTIRNQAIGHNQTDLPREKVYDINGTTPNEIMELIDITCGAINKIARELGFTNVIFDSKRYEDATLELLRALTEVRT